MTHVLYDDNAVLQLSTISWTVRCLFTPNQSQNGVVTGTWFPVTETGSGVDYYEIQATDGSMTTYMTKVYGGSLTATFSDVPEGTFSAKVRAADKLGNIGPWSNIETITIDTVLPVVDITSPSMNEFVSGTVTITFTISDLNLDDSTAMISTDNGQTWQVPNGGCIGGVCTHSWDTTVETDGLAYGILAMNVQQVI